MKGLATQTIVLIIIGLIVLGVIVTLLYISLGPFRESIRYNSCRAKLSEYCSTHSEPYRDYSKAMKGCSDVTWSSDRKPFSSGATNCGDDELCCDNALG